MIYVIDAWLERREPQLRIRNQETGRVVLSLKGLEIEKGLENAGFNWDDLIHLNKANDQEFANRLMEAQKDGNDTSISKPFTGATEEAAAWVYTI